MEQKYKLLADEQELNITVSRVDDQAFVDCTIPAHNNRLLRLCEKFPEEFQLTRRDNFGGCQFRFPKKYVKISSPRQLTEAHRQQAREQLKKVGNNRQNSEAK